MPKIIGIDTANIAAINGFFTSQTPSTGGTPPPSGATVSTTPTISANVGDLGAGIISITNKNTYTNPNFEFSIEVNGTEILSNTEVNRQLSSGQVSDTFTFLDSDTTPGTRTIKVKAQEFGDYIQSSEATTTYSKGSIQNHYIRLRGVNSNGSDTSSYIAISDIQFFTGQNGTGTEYPTTDLTSNTSETGIIVSAGQIYNSTYDAWKAVDSNTTNTMYWALGTSAANNWWQIQFDSATYPTAPEIKSIKVRFNASNQPFYFSLKSSSTGAFSGEEIDHGIYNISEKLIYLTFG